MTDMPARSEVSTHEKEAPTSAATLTITLSPGTRSPLIRLAAALRGRIPKRRARLARERSS
jgi:hypothetical protein